MTPLLNLRDHTQPQPIGWLPALAVATLALVLTATVADARGGRSHGRRIGTATSSHRGWTPVVTTSASSQAPQPTGPQAVTTSASSQAAQPTDPPAKPTVSLRNVGVIAAPPPPAPPTPAPQIVAPLIPLLPIAPLSLSTSTTNSTAVPTGLTTGGSSGVALPETPGGGREGLAACMEFWDSGTHMTKAEWKAACERSVNRLQTISGTKKD